MKYSIFEHGATFKLDDKTYMTIGTDTIKNQIECQSIPFNDKFYWFQVINQKDSLVTLERC